MAFTRGCQKEESKMKKIITLLIPLLILGCMCKPTANLLEGFEKEISEPETFDLYNDGTDDS